MTTLKNKDIIFSTNGNDYYDNNWMSRNYSGGKNRGVSFWGLDFDEDIDVITGETKIKDDNIVSTIKYSKYLRAISNFVKIMTNRDDITVNFATSDESYTSGNNIVISSDIDDGNFDATVGLTLHESAHVLKTNMKFLGILSTIIGKNENVIKKLMEKYNEKNPTKIKLAVLEKLRTLLNIIEDRRIDDFVYKTCPGYMVYYHALYDRYFNNDVITKTLLSDSLKEESWSSYIFRINYIVNPATLQTLDSLKSFKEIYNLIDIKNIGRLKDVQDSFNLAVEVFNIIENSISPKTNLESIGNKSDESGESTDSTDENKSNKGSSIEISKNDISSGISYDEVQKRYQELRSFLDGRVIKKELNNAQKDLLKIVDKANVYIKPVGEDKKVECVVIKKMTKELIDSKYFRNIFTHDNGNKEINNSCIKEGIKQGIRLGKQLKFRNEKQEIKYTRLKQGNLDKRIIAELGYNSNNVFYKKQISSFNDVYMHISVDASTSMRGEKWATTLKTVVAIAKAVSMISGIHLVISFRNSIYTNHVENPFILIAYDSKIDSFKKIEMLFTYLVPDGTTPEGLCFEAISNEFPIAVSGTDNYFMNFSDGMPCFRTFRNDQEGAAVTRKQIKKLINNNINIISYFITDDEGSYSANSDFRLFKEMYGNDAVNIDLKSIPKIATSINKRFLTKSNNN